LIHLDQSRQTEITSKATKGIPSKKFQSYGNNLQTNQTSMESVTEAADVPQPLYSNTVMKTGTYSKNATGYTSRIKITTCQNVLVQRCIGAVSWHLQA